MFPKSTNETFATKLFQQYRNHKRLSKPKLARTDFTISHYAGDVSIATKPALYVWMVSLTSVVWIFVHRVKENLSPFLDGSLQIPSVSFWLTWQFPVLILIVRCIFSIQVTYQTELFLDKNKDYVVAEHQSLLGSSTCPFVASLFPKSADEGSKSSYKFSSIGTRFKVCLL